MKTKIYLSKEEIRKAIKVSLESENGIKITALEFLELSDKNLFAVYIDSDSKVVLRDLTDVELANKALYAGD